MDAVRVALLRDVLAGTEWLGATRHFAGTLRGSVVSHGGGLLLVGTPRYEPWHLAAHLVDEAAWSGTPELAPTLVRHGARPSDPARNLAWAWGVWRRRGGVRRSWWWRRPGRRPGRRPPRSWSGVCGAPPGRGDGAVPGPGEGELPAMAHEALPVPDGSELDLDTVQHLVS
ncbi:hypothetical protein GCM10023238_26690 [Streptomyces heliomycini]